MPLWLLVWEVSEPPKRIQDIAITIVCLPQLGGKMLLLKTLHTSVQTWRNQDGNDLEVSSLLVSFQGDRRCYTGHWRRKNTNDPTHQGIMHAMIINCLARYHGGMTVIGVASHLLGGLEAGPQQEIYVWYYIPS